MTQFLKIMLYTLLIAIFTCSRPQNHDTEQPEDITQNPGIQISLSVKSLALSSDFYRIIGLQKIDGREQGEYPWALFTDGKIQYMLSQNQFYSPAITFFVESLENKLKELSQKGLNIFYVEGQSNNSASGIMTDPNGFGIIFIQMDLNKLPPLTGDKTKQSIQLKEILMQTAEIDSTLIFWKNIGLQSIEESHPTQHGLVYDDGKLNINLEKVTESKPPILIFQTDNLSTVTNTLENAGFKIVEKISSPSNLFFKTIVKSPENILIHLISE